MGRAVRQASATPGRRRLVRTALALLAVVSLVLLYHLALYVYVDRTIGRVDALAVDGPEVLAPELQEGAETYLIVGTGLPGQDGPASVATLLASVSAEADRAVLVSVPPTAFVDTPTCRTEGGSLREPTSEAFADSLLRGGPSCIVRATQQVSGLRVDHYLGVDLSRLPAMVDALGGISVCVPASPAVEAAAEPLPAGRSEVSGAGAAGYLRPGEAGSDVVGAAAAERAQLLLTSTLRAALSVGTLTDPVALTRFLTRASDALTVDRQTTLGDLRGLAGVLRDLDAGDVQHAGLPVAQVGYVPAGQEQAYVLLDGGRTRALFDAVIADTRVPDDFLAGEPAAAPPGAAEQPAAASPAAPGPEAPATAEAAGPAVSPGSDPLTVAPGGVTVDVLNGTGTTGLAATVAEALRGQGFGVGTIGNEPGTVNQTVVRHGPGVGDPARTVAAAVPGAVLQPSDAIGDRVQLIIGPNYSTVVPVQLGAPAAPSEAAPSAAPPAETAAPEAAAPACA